MTGWLLQAYETKMDSEDLLAHGSCRSSIRLVLYLSCSSCWGGTAAAAAAAVAVVVVAVVPAASQSQQQQEL